MPEPRTLTLRLTLDVTYDLEEFEGSSDKARQFCTNQLDKLVNLAAGDGLMSGFHEAITVDFWDHSVKVLSQTGDVTGDARGIKARAWLDDRSVEADFDASPWFSQASADEIRELFVEGLSGNCRADEVAQFCAQTDNDVSILFDVLHARRRGRHVELGFECEINEDSVRKWLKAYRPDIVVDEDDE